MSARNPVFDEQRSCFIAMATVLVGVGVVMVHSASITSRPSEFEAVYLSRHLTFLAIGVAAAFCASLIPARIWIRVAPALFLVSLALLIVVLLPGVGTRVNGSQRWLRYQGFSVQPSELAKVALPLICSRLIVRRRQQMRRWMSGIIPLLLPAIVTLPLIVAEPDLGTAAFLAIGYAMTLYIGGWPIRNFVLSGLLIAPAAWLVALRPYQMARITGFLQAWNDMNQAPWQIRQSLYSLGAGGLGGSGIGRGWQKLSFLPEANTDFVFSVVGEELGLAGTLTIVCLWIAVFVTGMLVLSRLPRCSFKYIAGVSLLAQLVLQAAVNVAVVTAMVPTKGLPHPLLSYGGSNLVTTLLTLGIILSLSQRSFSTPLLADNPARLDDQS